MVNRQIRLAARPIGFPRATDFDLVYSPLPRPARGEVLVRVDFLSLDPYMRNLMNESASNAQPVGLGEVMIGAGVGRVFETKSPQFSQGDVVVGMPGWQEYSAVPGGDLKRLDLDLGPASTALGVLGRPGLTAYFGLLDICDPQPGETVVVSAAAEAVGMIAGQIARIRGCRVIGLAGSAAKTAWLLDELGFDGAINYRVAADLKGEIDELCPDGVDAYFDNVGGGVTDAVVRRINVGGRIALCGQSSQYNLEEPELGPRWLEQLIDRRASMKGFRVEAYSADFPKALEQLAFWLRRGDLRYREDVALGIQTAPLAFIGMLRGRNQGKQLVQLSGL